MHKINFAIRAPEGLLIGADGKPMGKKPLKEAMTLAQDAGLDLIQVNESPAVFKIADHAKMVYELKKNEKKNHKPKHNDVLKEIKFKPNIGLNDIKVKTKKIKELLEENYKVKISMYFHGRAKFMPKDAGIAIVKDVYLEATGHEINVADLKITGNAIFALASPVRK